MFVYVGVGSHTPLSGRVAAWAQELIKVWIAPGPPGPFKSCHKGESVTETPRSSLFVSSDNEGLRMKPQSGAAFG